MTPTPHQSDLDLLANLSRRSWLIGVNQHQVLDLASQRLAELVGQPTVLLAEAEPANFLAGFLAATVARCPLVLGNPAWQSEWQQVLTHIRPERVWGVRLPEAAVQTKQPEQPLAPGWILIPTGGSSGQIRYAIHTWETLRAAVLGFQTYFGIEQINSWCLLPLYHVSGLMQVMRALLTDGNLMLWPFPKATLSSSPLFSPSQCSQFDPAGWFLSLVPTQLQRLLLQTEGQTWLREFHTVFVGGAPAWSELLEEARQQQIRLAPTYGMTETAAQIATLKPDAFLDGESSCGPVLPHAKIEILPSPDLSPHPTASQTGQICIRASSLMLGYFPPTPHLPISPSPHLSTPHLSTPPAFLTDDLGYLNQGHLHIVGRSSSKIITGGENVFPVEVEAAIRATGLVSDVCVLGLPDATWGEAVVAICVAARPEAVNPGAANPKAANSEAANPELQTKLQAELGLRLSRYKQPKRWIWVEQLPRNAQGKINLIEIRQFLASDQTHTPPRRPAESSAGVALERPPNWQ